MAKKKEKVKTKARSAISKIKKSASRVKNRVAKAVRKAAPKKKVAKAISRAKAVLGPRRPKWIATGSNPVNPYLIVRDIKTSLNFYQNVFGFKVRFTMPGPNNTIMHAEMVYHDSLVMMGPEFPERGAFAPQGPSPVTLYLFVENVDRVAQKAAQHGGTIIQAPADSFWGDRCAIVTDPSGHSWMIATHIKDVPYDQMKPPTM